MSQQRVKPPVKPVFTVAEPNIEQVMQSISLIAQATANFYTALTVGGVPDETARELTKGFIAMLSSMWGNAP